MNDLNKRISRELIKSTLYGDMIEKIKHHINRDEWLSVKEIIHAFLDGLHRKIFNFECDTPNDFTTISDWKDWIYRKRYNDFGVIRTEKDSAKIYRELDVILEDLITGIHQMNDINKRISQELIKSFSYGKLIKKIENRAQGRSVEAVINTFHNNIWMKLYEFECDTPSDFNVVSDWKDWINRRISVDLSKIQRENKDPSKLYRELGFIFEEMMTGCIK